MSSKPVCDLYHPHAFLQNSKCIDCDHPKDAHTNFPPPKEERRGSVLARDNYLNAFDNLNFESVLKIQCSHYTPHAWIYDRCRDCGGVESGHATSSVPLSDQPSAEALAAQRGSVSGESRPGFVRRESAFRADAPKQRDTSHIGHLDIFQFNPEEGTSEATQKRVHDAEAKMKAAVAKMMVIEKEFDKRKDEIATKKGGNYEKDMAALKEAYTKKECEMKEEIETARQDIAASNEAREEEIKAIRANAAQEIAEAKAKQKEAEDKAREAESKQKEAEEKQREAEEKQKAAEVVVKYNTMEMLQVEDEDESEEQPTAQPATPALADLAVGRDDAVQLSQVLANVAKMFQQGQNVIRFRLEGPATFISVFIRMISTNDKDQPQYSLYWTKADRRNVHATRCLEFSEISAVVIGKQASVLQRDIAHAADDALCVSFIAAPSTNKRSLHLRFGNERDRDTWAYGIASLMKEYGSKPAVYEKGQYKESEAERAREKNDYVEEDSKALPYTQEDVDSIRVSSQPKIFSIKLSTKCNNLPSVHKNTIVCLVDRNEKTNKLVYLNQTERISGSGSPVFKKKFPLTFVDSAARTLRFNVYDVPDGAKSIEDPFRVGSAVVTIKELVDNNNTDFEYVLAHKDARKNSALEATHATLTVRCVERVQTGGGIEPTPEQKTLLAQVREVEKLMCQGDTFRSFVADHEPSNVTVAYKPGQSQVTPGSPSSSQSHPTNSDAFDLGVLNWQSIGSVVQSLQLRTIVDLFKGKKSSVFPIDSKDDCCFSLVSRTGARLDLEAKSKEQRDAWVTGVITLLKYTTLLQQLAKQYQQQQAQQQQQQVSSPSK